MTRQDYQKALDSGELEALQRAYNYASRRVCDRRFRREARDTANEFLPRLTAALRSGIERERPCGGVI